MESQASQCIHVQLHGGAPWGFTLKGGLEHGEPLIISKIEDGGKAAKSEKMEVGDELVNINGTPLYGSRQEALILIKGSYKILKMIVRRRNVSVVRPHSWHLAKLYEVHPDVASMQYPTDAFSLSWHSGCETSELPVQWNPLSRHCSTDKSSSIGSMESLDHPGQNYYEGTLSPIDPSMYQNKRDSAYSSFSASSNTSDYTLSARTDEPSPFNCNLGMTKQEDGRYLQTGQSVLDSQDSQTVAEHTQRPSSFPYDANLLDSIKYPPQPPVRRDSLRAPKNQGCHTERRRASAPGETFYIPGKWSKDTNQLGPNGGQGQCANQFYSFHQKENLSSDQYYMLSSQTDSVIVDNIQLPISDKRQNNICTEQNNGWSHNKKDAEKQNHEDDACVTVQKIREHFLKKSCEHLKSKHNASCQEERSNKTVFINNENMASSETCHFDADNGIGESIDKKCQKRIYDGFPSTTHIVDSNDHGVTVHHGVSIDRSDKSKEPLSSQPNHLTGEQEQNAGPAKKPGSSRNRSAQMRRKSDRFATNLRNEIQKRKSQLKGSSVLLCGEDPVEERDEPIDCQPRLGPPPPPPPKNKARLLEIKKANSGKLCIPDCSSQEKVENCDLENIKAYTYKKEDIISRSPSHFLTNSSDSTDEKACNTFRNHALDDWFEKSSSDVRHKESVVGEENHLNSQKETKRLLSHSNDDMQQAAKISPKSESCRDEWKIVSSSKSNISNIRVREKETIVESMKCGEEHLDLSVKDKNNSEKLRTSSGETICPTDMLTETFTKSRPKDKLCIKNSIIFGNQNSLNSTHGKIPCGSERSVGDQRIINNTVNKDQEQKVIELNLFELGTKDVISSTCSVSESPCQPSCSEEVISQHRPHSAKCSLSPDHCHHPHPHSQFSKESPPEVCGLNMDGVVPPVTRNLEENVLMPFADRRRFFEDSSKVPTSTHISMHINANKNGFCSNLSDYPLPHVVPPDLRRHSVDHTFYPSSPNRQDSVFSCSECCINHVMEPPLCCIQSGHSSVPYGYRSCAFCSNDLCPALLKRTHHSCHCQHHHHYHHPWSRCGEVLCPSQHSLLDEGSPILGDQWHSRPILQEVPLKEWNQKKINRKCSQSVRELCHFNTGFHHLGPHRSYCEGSDQEWPQCYKATSTYDLSCDHPLRPVDLASMQDGPTEQGLSRGRAYSVNQLNLDSLAFRDKQDLSKLDEREPLARPKKQAPPRPPPPNWEKYKERKSSHEFTKIFSGHACCNDAPLIHGHSEDDARQRSHSLPTNTFLQVQQSPTLLLQGNDYSTEPSEMRDVSQDSQDDSFSVSPSQEPLKSVCFKDSDAAPSSNAAQSEKADEEDPEEHSFSSKTSKTELISPVNTEREYPPTMIDIFEGSYRRFEDDWSTDRESEISIPERYEFQPISPPPVCGAVSPTCSSYYNTSVAKAGLLNKMKEMPGMPKETDITEAEEEEDELTFKKMQLIESITRKVSVLHEAQLGLQEDVNANLTLGCELENLLKALCKPHEYDKFRSFIGDLDKVVNLLLSLSGRLSRVESALNCEEPAPSMEEKLNLMEKKKQLTDQLEDAEELKAHVTRREQVVLEAVSKYLNEEQLQDYQHYVRMTSALIVEQRELEDKIRLGEEQLRCLRESL